MKLIRSSVWGIDDVVIHGWMKSSLYETCMLEIYILQAQNISIPDCDIDGSLKVLASLNKEGRAVIILAAQDGWTLEMASDISWWSLVQESWKHLLHHRFRTFCALFLYYLDCFYL